VLVVEQDPALVEQLQRTQAHLKAEMVRVQRGDGVAALRHGGTAAWNLVLIDPPFDSALFAPALAASVATLAAGGWVYLEAPKAWQDVDLAGLRLCSCTVISRQGPCTRTSYALSLRRCARCYSQEPPDHVYRHDRRLPRTFDPITLGHQDLIARAAALFRHRDRCGRGGVPQENHVQPGGAHGHRGRGDGGPDPNVQVQGLHRPGQRFSRSVGARVMLRGVRSVTDFDYEAQLAGMNRALEPGLDTVFMTPDPRFQHISSTLVREIATLRGDVSQFVAPPRLGALASQNARLSISGNDVVALIITDECINCDVCEPECPNAAISMGLRRFM
jgi:pantetheine-phosphate adenylyltransferase